MPVAKKESELQQIADEDLEKKIKAEKPFKKDILKLLRKINDEFAQQYIAEETVIDANEFKPEMMAILASNYNKISKKFKFNIRESFDEQVSDEVNAKINSEINKYIKTTSNAQSDLILNTTNNDVREELANTIADFIDEEKELNTPQLAKETRKSLNDKSIGRATTISMYETENSSESSKEIEETVLVLGAVILGGIAIAEELMDVWVAILDEITRIDHVIADGQEKRPGESFVVGGELLRFPGDPQGRPGNIINCRCSSVRKVF